MDTDLDSYLRGGISGNEPTRSWRPRFRRSVFVFVSMVGSALVVMALYQIITLCFGVRTLGKRILQLRIVSYEGLAVSKRSAIIRALARLAMPIIVISPVIPIFFPLLILSPIIANADE